MRRPNYYLIGLILVTFFVIAFISTIFGAIIPDMIASFHLSLTLVAVLPFAFYFAYGVMSIPTGLLIKRYRERTVMAMGFLLAFAGCMGFAVLPSYTVAVLSLFLVGAGMAMLQVVINPLLREAGGEEHFAFNLVLASLTFFLGAFVGPRAYTYLVQGLVLQPERMNLPLKALSSVVPDGLRWVSLYWVFAALSFLMLAVVLASRFPPAAPMGDRQAASPKVYLALLRTPVVRLFFFAILTYVGCEQSIGAWISQFLLSYHGYDAQNVGAAAVSWYWGMFAVGCVVGMLLLKIYDSRTVLAWFTAGAMGMLTAALYGSAAVALLAFPLIGFFESVMWGVLFSLALNSVKEHHGAFSGILVTGILGGAVFPFLIGWLGDHWGLRVGISVLYLNFTFVLGVAFWAKPIVNNETFGNRRKATLQGRVV